MGKSMGVIWFLNDIIILILVLCGSRPLTLTQLVLRERARESERGGESETERVRERVREWGKVWGLLGS